MGRWRRWTAAALLIAVPVAVYVPVRQAAQQRELAFEIAQLEREIQLLDEEIRKLSVEIAELESPERLVPLIELYTGVRKASEEELVIVTDGEGREEESDE